MIHMIVQSCITAFELLDLQNMLFFHVLHFLCKFLNFDPELCITNLRGKKITWVSVEITVIYNLQLLYSWTSVFWKDSTQDFLAASEFPEFSYSPSMAEQKLFTRAVSCHT